MSDATKEMTLEEWVNALPKFHFANKQYQELTAALASSERKRHDAERWRELTKHHAPYEAAIVEFRQHIEVAESSAARLEEENGRLRCEIGRIANDYHPDPPEEAMLALWEMRQALESLLSLSTPGERKACTHYREDPAITYGDGEPKGQCVCGWKEEEHGDAKRQTVIEALKGADFFFVGDDEKEEATLKFYQQARSWAYRLLQAVRALEEKP